MKIWLISLLLIISGADYTLAQKVSVEKWVKHNVDSLHKIHVDTIEYYNQYCGECVVRKPGTEKYNCQTENGYTLAESFIMYQQHGKYYSLEFNCNYPLIKKELNGLNSLSYFVLIIPILNRRDKLQDELFKRHKFLPPVISDGIHEKADIYLNKLRQTIAMHTDEKTNKAWQSYFWIKKQTKLFELLEADVSPKNVKE
jgi:hypothetical protein